MVASGDTTTIIKDGTLSPSGVRSPSSSRALQVPEIVQLIQEQLLLSACGTVSTSTSRKSTSLPPVSAVTALVRSLQVSSTWYRAGRHLVWRSVAWKEDTMADTRHEHEILAHAPWIRSLTCYLSPPSTLSFGFNRPPTTAPTQVPTMSSSIINAHRCGWEAIVRFLIHGYEQYDEGVDQQRLHRTHTYHTNGCTGRVSSPNQQTRLGVALGLSDTMHTLANNGQNNSVIPPLRELLLKGYITTQTLDNLFTSTGNSGFLSPNRLTCLTISLSEDTIFPSGQDPVKIDILKVLSALPRLVYLELDLEGLMQTPVSEDVNAATSNEGEEEEDEDEEYTQSHCAFSSVRHELETLKIRRLRLTREDLEWVLDRCPLLKELATTAIAPQLWQRPPPAIPPSPVPPLPAPAPPLSPAITINATVLPHNPIPIPSQISHTLGIPQVVPSHHPQEHSHTAVQQQIPQLQEEEMSLVMTLASKCPHLESLQIGLRKGSLSLEDIQEIMAHLKKLRSLGLPAGDCTKDILDALLPSNQDVCQPHGKTVIENHSMPPSPACMHFYHKAMLTTARTILTTLVITTTCSSEKTSQAIHDFLCVATHLDTFEALNTTLYLDQMQSSKEDEEGGRQEQRPKWACTQLRTLKVRFARLPWRTRRPSDSAHHMHAVAHAQRAVPNPTLAESFIPKEAASTLSSPPTSPSLQPLQQRHQHHQLCSSRPPSPTSLQPDRNPDLYHFLTPCKKLERLLIKEGLVLQQGREYESLSGLDRLQHLVFATCYPVPIQAADLDWLKPSTLPSLTSHDTHGLSSSAAGVTSTPSSASVLPKLRRVTIRRSKQGDRQQEQAVIDWFQRHRPQIEFTFQWSHEWDDDAI